MAARSEFRRSQGVVPFGVGAIIDFKEESLMAAGLDVWPTETSGEQRTALLGACQVLDGRLADRLSVEFGRPIRYFLSPAEAQERAAIGATPRLDRAPMPFVRFPNWYFCPRCRVLKDIAWNTQSLGDTLKCSHMGRRVEGKGEPCGSLHAKRRPHLSPVRFVAACEGGHIMDFPWREWAHKDSDRSCGGGGDLYLYSTPAAGLAGVRVMCSACGASNSMAGAFRENVLADIFADCPGHRPWLGPDAHEKCVHFPQTIQRGASNAYFAKVVSSILIPPYSAKIRQMLDRPDIWDEILSIPLVDGNPHEPFLRTKAKNLGLDADSFAQAVRERMSVQGGEKSPQDLSETRYRFEEYKAFLGPRPPAQERQDFDTRSVSADEYGGAFAQLFERVVLVRKLRETRVLTGFSRIVPPDAVRGEPAQLSRKPKPWLPGFSVRGEGIFLQFRRTALDAWSARRGVEPRAALVAARSAAVNRARGLPVRPLSPDMLLVHTLSHLLIRQLAFECGYDSSSIRERLYVSSDDETRMAGFLLYTASGDSEGTLGGLVRQGEPGRLETTIRAGMRNAVICSSDPLCIESSGQGLFSLNLAACHACSLLPETSCEESNSLLDRALAVGTPDHPELGYLTAFLG